MDTQTGKLYPTYEAAVADGVENVTMLEFSVPADAERISKAVSALYRAERKAKNKAAKASRRNNRRK